jgi:hypothetical protein
MTTKTPKAEQAIAEQFTTWAGAVDQADVATVTLSIALINSSVSTRKASEIAVATLGGKVRGWTKDRISAVRWTAPLWASFIDRPADDVVTDDDGNDLGVEAILARVSTLANRLGKARVEDAIATVDVPSVSAFVQALEDAVVAREIGGENVDPVEGVEDEVEAEAKPGKTDADRIKAILSTLSGIEFDETLADALPALIDAVVDIAGRVSSPATPEAVAV